MLSPAIKDKVKKDTLQSMGRLLKEELWFVKKNICAVNLIRVVKRKRVTLEKNKACSSVGHEFQGKGCN